MRPVTIMLRCLYVLLYLSVLPMAALRLFGWVWFFDTLSVWHLVPALSIAALIGAPAFHAKHSKRIAVVAMAAYLLSLAFAGIDHTRELYAEGGYVYLFNIVEGLLIVFMFWRVLEYASSVGMEGNAETG
jgi:hypothetical protein